MKKFSFFSVMVALTFMFSACNKSVSDQINDEGTTVGIKGFAWTCNGEPKYGAFPLDCDDVSELFAYGQVTASDFAHFPSGGTQFNNEWAYPVLQMKGVYLFRDKNDKGNGWVEIFFTTEALEMLNDSEDCEWSIGVRYKGSLNAVYTFYIEECVKACGSFSDNKENTNYFDVQKYKEGDGIRIQGSKEDAAKMGPVTQIRFAGDFGFMCTPKPVEVTLNFHQKEGTAAWTSETVLDDTESLLCAFTQAGFDATDQYHPNGDNCDPAPDYDALMKWFGLKYMCQIEEHYWYAYDADGEMVKVNPNGPIPEELVGMEEIDLYPYYGDESCDTSCKDELFEVKYIYKDPRVALGQTLQVQNAVRGDDCSQYAQKIDYTWDFGIGECVEFKFWTGTMNGTTEFVWTNALTGPTSLYAFFGPKELANVSELEQAIEDAKAVCYSGTLLQDAIDLAESGSCNQTAVNQMKNNLLAAIADGNWCATDTSPKIEFGDKGPCDPQQNGVSATVTYDDKTYAGSIKFDEDSSDTFTFKTSDGKSSITIWASWKAINPGGQNPICVKEVRLTNKNGYLIWTNPDID